MRQRQREVAIVGVGQTKYSSHREDVNQPEMIAEAIFEVLDQTGLIMDDIDCIVHGNMELFEMIYQPDLWHTLGTGARGKECLRLTTGGTTGATLLCAADALVASGMHDVVMVIGFEKLQEGHTTGGITNMADPLWGRKLQSGALMGITASQVIEEFGEIRAKKASIDYRIIMDMHAMKNSKAHRRLGLDFDMAEELMNNSPRLVGELRMIHMCSQSDGACVVILACEEKAKKICDRPAWILDHVTVHREEHMGTLFGLNKVKSTHRHAAQTLFKRNNITNPLQEFDVFEMYDPSSWWGLDWLREFLLFEQDEHLKLIEQREICIDGKLPVNPSGGVIASNPIGATALIRFAEAALQIMGKAGDHQIKGDVDKALASGFGGTLWTVLGILVSEKPKR